jgi:lysophospholipase L1-like esterase
MGPVRLPRLRAALAALAAALATALVPAAATASEYVALGDSFVAGPLIPMQVQPYGCLKSDRNYARLAAPQLGLELTDASCSGAKTKHMFEPQDVSPGPNPPQLDAVGPDAKLVTLGIGGNDIGFSELANGCLSTSPYGSPCRDRYVVDGVDEISRRIAATAPKVAAVLQGIRERAPEADVRVVNYPTIFPDSGPGCYALIPIADGDVAWLRQKHKELNRMLAEQAVANGASVLDWYTPSIGNDACKLPGTKWVEAVVPTTPAAPIHPNLIGMHAAAGLLVSAVEGS